MEGHSKTVLALGMFDGMHIGHQSLLWRAKALAKSRGCPAVVFTFSNHPLEVLGGKPRLLTSLAARERLIRACGIDEVVTEPFTKELSERSPEEFVDLLCQRFHPAAIVTGFNYTFGRFGSGTPKTLSTLGKRRGFDTEAIPPVSYLGVPVSSTRIRRCVEDGDMKSATSMLMRPYRLSGIVVKNMQNGKRLGFPTANIDPDPLRAIPRDGVYATLCCVDGACFKSVTNIGTNPTFDGQKVTVESHMSDFSDDIYGRMLTVDFVSRIRDEIKFESEEALKEQMRKDIAQARHDVV